MCAPTVYQSSIQCWAIIGTSAKRHLNGVSLAGRGWLAFSGIWTPPLINFKNKTKQNKTKKCQSWTPSEKTFWIRTCTGCSGRSYRRTYNRFIYILVTLHLLRLNVTKSVLKSDDVLTFGINRPLHRTLTPRTIIDQTS